MTPELEALLQRARAAYDAMTPEQKEQMHKEQKESWVRAEINWPKPKCKMIDGVKVYDSYEDYCNG